MSNFIKVCPKCGGENIVANYNAYGDIGIYNCKDCLYSGQLFPEVAVEELEEFRKTIRK